MASVVVCAEPGSWRQAGIFATKVLGDAELRTYEDVRRRVPSQPILVYLTHPDFDHLRSLLRVLQPGSPDVVVYCAKRLGAQDAAQLGKVVGETRPEHTSVVFAAKAAVASMLQHARLAGGRNGGETASHTRRLRERFGMTQTEMARAIGVSLRSVQGWERSGVVRKSNGCGYFGTTLQASGYRRR